MHFYLWTYPNGDKAFGVDNQASHSIAARVPGMSPFECLITIEAAIMYLLKYLMKLSQLM